MFILISLVIKKGGIIIIVNNFRGNGNLKV